jgi:hypothetical protein
MKVSGCMRAERADKLPAQMFFLGSCIFPVIVRPGGFVSNADVLQVCNDYPLREAAM